MPGRDPQKAEGERGSVHGGGGRGHPRQEAGPREGKKAA